MHACKCVCVFFRFRILKSLIERQLETKINSSSSINDYSCIDSSAWCFLGLQCSIGSCRGWFGSPHTSTMARVILDTEFDGAQWSRGQRGVAYDSQDQM